MMNTDIFATHSDVAAAVTVVFSIALFCFIGKARCDEPKRYVTWQTVTFGALTLVGVSIELWFGDSVVTAALMVLLGAGLSCIVAFLILCGAVMLGKTS